MAMLAEPRRKQKWVLNPRGKDWSNDTNKFGQRMLEKMGWTTGKGLGINEQGTTQHVKVKVKNDTVGIGFKNEQDEAWTEHQKAFDSFLNLLQENQDSNLIKKTNTENSVVSTQSLELKSKQSRARVHYQKFTRGKDVKKYSAKDLADILGGRHILNKESKVEELHENDTNITNVAHVENITGGTVTINRGSITDYFKKKTSHFLKDKENNTSCMDVSDNETEQYRGFGFVSKSPNHKQTNKSKLECNYTFDNPALELHSSGDVLEDTTKCLNKRKGESLIENDIQNLGYEQNFAKKIKIDDNDKNCKGFINMALDLDTDVNESHVTNKFEVSRVKFGLTNDALDLTDEIHEKKRVTFNNHVEYSTDSSKKKKHTGTLDKFEVDSKKRKKKQKQFVNTNLSNKIGFVNEALDINLMSQELKDNKVNECKSKKNKKQKQRRISNLETIEETSEEAGINNNKEVENSDKNIDANLTNEESVYEENNINIKKKKKKSKNKTQETITVTDDIDDAISYIPENINYSQKKEKIKKKNKHIAMGNDITCEEITEKTRCKKNITKKHRHEENITNVPLDENKEDLVVEKTVIDDKSTEKSKHKRTHNKKHINEDLECELEDRKNKEVPCEKIQHNDERVKVKAKIKHDKISQKVFDDTNKNDSTITEKNVSDIEMQLKDVEHSKINPEENMTLTNDRNFCIENPKLSKRILKLFFELDYITDFPGSNINKIKGYGADIIQ